MISISILGAQVHAQTQTGDTALTYACENGHSSVAEVLLDNQSKIRPSPTLWSHLILFYFEFQGEEDRKKVRRTNEKEENGAVQSLLDNDAELEHESEGGRTQLMKAARYLNSKFDQ